MEIKKYRPSNGTEGDVFMCQFCQNCIHEKFMHTQNHDDKQCDIFNRAFLHEINEPEFPLEWQYDATGNPTCTAFVNWNWNKDDDGNWIDPPQGPDEGDPNQLMLFSITDDILRNKDVKLNVSKTDA